MRLLANHQSQIENELALSRGFAPRTSAFAGRRAETDYTLRAKGNPKPETVNASRVNSDFDLRTSDFNLASVIGLAPIRPGLKDRLLELLCIHGQKGGQVGR